MDSPQTLIAFGAVMLVIALLAVAVDWVGKPMRGRKFVPKIYRFPDERQPRRSQVRETDWSHTAFVLPVVEAPRPEMLVRYPDPLMAGSPEVMPELAFRGVLPADSGPPTAQVPLFDLDHPLVASPERLSSNGMVGPRLVTLEEVGSDRDGLLDPDTIGANGTGPEALGEGASGHRESDGVEDPTDPNDAAGECSAFGRAIGWAPGEYVFNFTADGTVPSPATVRERYWKNVAVTAGASMFGDANNERMAAGRAPERRNPRTGRLESMKLPSVDYDDTGGETPVPQWPSDAIDPFTS